LSLLTLLKNRTAAAVLGGSINDEINPLFDDALVITIGGVDVTDDLLPGASWTTTMPGGFGDATLSLRVTSPWGPYHASVVKGAAVSIIHDGTSLFKGFVTNDLSHAVLQNGQWSYDVTAAGYWWKAGQKQDFCCVFTDDDYGVWQVSPRAYKPYSADTDGRLYVGAEVGAATKADSRASIFYWLHEGLGSGNDAIRYFIAKLNYDLDNANWYFDLSTSPTNPWGTWTVQQTWNAAAAAAGFTIIACPAGTQALRASLYCSATGTAATLRYMEMTEACVVATDDAFYEAGCSMSAANPTTVTTTADHPFQTGDRVALMRSGGATGPHGWYTVTKTGAKTFTVAVLGTTSYTLTVCGGVRPCQAMSAVAGGDAKLTTGLATGGDDPSFGAIHYGLYTRPFGTRAEAIDHFASLHDEPIDYAFWEASEWVCAERVAPAASYDYLIDSEDTPGIDYNVFSDVENSPAYVKVTYKTRDAVGSIPAGTVLDVYRPSEPDWDTAGYVVDVLDYSDVSMNAQEAQNIGDRYLDWVSENQYVGSISIACPTVPTQTGGTQQTAYIYAGDYIEDSEHATGRLMITSTSYDLDRGVMTLGIGENRREFAGRVKTIELRQPRDTRNGTGLKPRP